MERFKYDVEAIADGGEAKIKIPSTIVKIDKGKVLVLRTGPIKKEDIDKKLLSNK